MATDSDPELEELRRILTTQSIRTGDFQLASGQRSHYYCDTKATVLSPRGAHLCGRALYRLLAPSGVAAVGGLAMGAVYLATAVAIASDQEARPIYGFVVRPETKDHGTAQRIDESWHPDGERLLRPGRPVAVVDDVVTTAGSVLRALDAVEATGAEVRLVAAVVDRQAGGAEAIRQRGYPFVALFRADQQGMLHPQSDSAGR